MNYEEDLNDSRGLPFINIVLSILCFISSQKDRKAATHCYICIIFCENTHQKTFLIN